MPSEVENLILIKRSSVSGVVPQLSSLEIGELGLNTADGKIFLKTETPELTSIKEFLNSDEYPYNLNTSLSSISPKYGNNNVSEIFSVVLGGYNNDISGGGSSVVNGEDNDIDADFGFIGSGFNNKISLSGDYSFIGAGRNNLINHTDVFTLGSNITSHASNFTYVQNLSVVGNLYGNGSNLTGIANSGQTSGAYLPLSGGNLTGAFTTTSTISSSQTISSNGARVITGLSTDTTPVYFMTVLAQSAYDALGTKNPNTIYFISNP